MSIMKHRRIAVLSALVLTFGLVTSSSWASTAQPEPSPSSAATAADTQTAEPVASPDPQPSDQVEQGTATVDTAATMLTREVKPTTKQTRDGAVEAFTAYAGWLTSSPAVKNEPQLAVETIGEDLLNPGEAQMLANMQRAEDVFFDIAAGAYRVLAHSGDQDQPDQVMLEVSAPMTNAGNTRWLVVGGVVAWRDGRWQLVSIMPTEVKQPKATDTRAQHMTTADQGKVFDGLGWRLFAAPGR